jgi:hypothetical protein
MERKQGIKSLFSCLFIQLWIINWKIQKEVGMDSFKEVAYLSGVTEENQEKILVKTAIPW